MGPTRIYKWSRGGKNVRKQLVAVFKKCRRKQALNPPHYQFISQGLATLDSDFSRVGAMNANNRTATNGGLYLTTWWRWSSDCFIVTRFMGIMGSVYLQRYALASICEIRKLPYLGCLLLQSLPPALFAVAVKASTGSTRRKHGYIPNASCKAGMIEHITHIDLITLPESSNEYISRHSTHDPGCRTGFIHGETFG